MAAEIGRPACRRYAAARSARETRRARRQHPGAVHRRAWLRSPWRHCRRRCRLDFARLPQLLQVRRAGLALKRANSGGRSFSMSRSVMNSSYSKVAAALAVPLKTVELAGAPLALDHESDGVGAALRRMRHPRRQQQDLARADGHIARAVPPRWSLAASLPAAGRRTPRPGRHGSRGALFGPPTTMMMNSLSRKIRLLPTGGFKSARCSSIQRCRFSGCSDAMACVRR